MRFWGRRSDDLVERGERAVVELHHHALQRRQRRRDLEQMQIDRLIGAEHLAGSDTEGEGVTDLAGSAGDRDVDGTLHGERLCLAAKGARILASE
jgi:hypothetical protein